MLLLSKEYGELTVQHSHKWMFHRSLVVHWYDLKVAEVLLEYREEDEADRIG